MKAAETEKQEEEKADNSRRAETAAMQAMHRAVLGITRRQAQEMTSAASWEQGGTALLQAQLQLRLQLIEEFDEQQDVPSDVAHSLYTGSLSLFSTQVQCSPQPSCSE